MLPCREEVAGFMSDLSSCLDWEPYLSLPLLKSLVVLLGWMLTPWPIRVSLGQSSHHEAINCAPIHRSM